MALVAIEEQHLHDIGDALRSVYGETREEDVYTYHTVFCTDGATGFDNINTSVFSISEQIKETITFSGASSIVVKMSYYDDGVMWFSINDEEMPSNTDESAIIEKTFDGDKVSFTIYVSSGDSAVEKLFGLYAEIYGYDADGNPVHYSVSTEDVKNTYKPREIAPAVKDLCHIPEEVFVVTGNCQYRFANGGWDWFIEQFGDKITTENINNAAFMFYGAKITEIPFELNFVDDGSSTNSIFLNCSKLTRVPSIDFKQTSAYKDDAYMFQGCQHLTSIGVLKNLYPSALNGFFNSCYRLRELPSFENLNLSRTHSYNYASLGNMFNYCYSLRSIPMELLRELYNTATSVSNMVYYNGFTYCYVLDELVGLPVTEAVTITSNMFYNTFANCCRLKSVIFGTNDDGSVKTAKWKTQTVDLAGTSANYAVGMAYLTSWVTGFNSGITEDTLVTDDATYQALKDNPDWWTKDLNYSRYNHDSAVETINSLPDTSAYLATAGGTNTIKFRGDAGTLTDGGAINTLTEAEIAVATAKGWTVTLV